MDASSPLQTQLGLIAPKRLLSDRPFLLALLAGCLLGLVFGALFNAGGWLDRGWLPVLSLVLWAPVIEELAFRGVVQGYLSTRTLGRRIFAGLSVANIVAAVLFTAWHLVYRTDLGAWLVFFPALVFGYFRDRHGSVVPCMILHAAYNVALLPGGYLVAT